MTFPSRRQSPGSHDASQDLELHSCACETGRSQSIEAKQIVFRLTVRTRLCAFCVNTTSPGTIGGSSSSRVTLRELRLQIDRHRVRPYPFQAQTASSRSRSCERPRSRPYGTMSSDTRFGGQSHELENRHRAVPPRAAIMTTFFPPSRPSNPRSSNVKRMSLWETESIRCFNL
jgi:hypothetical protein